jgi:phenylacetate-CoA ligase
LMSPVKGRISDLIRLPDGAVISGDYVTTLFDEYPEVVRAFQIRQNADYSIVVNVVPNTESSQVDYVLRRTEDILRAKTGAQVPIRSEIVDAIRSDRGKMRYIISDLNATCRDHNGNDDETTKLGPPCQ